MTKKTSAALVVGMTLLSAAAGFAQTPTAAQHSAMMKHQAMMKQGALKRSAMIYHQALMHHKAAPSATPSVAPATP